MRENLPKLNLTCDVNETEDLFQFENNSFNVITLWHVLEHIHRLSENMEAIVRLLKDDGKLIIAVPNHESYDAQTLRRILGCIRCSDVTSGILHPAQMKTFGERYGLKLEKIKTCLSIHFMFRFSAKNIKNRP